MAQNGFTPIQLYRSATPGAVPLAADLAAGELALNTADEKLFFENASGAVVSIDRANGTVTSVAASGGSTGLTFSGSPITTAGTLTLAGTLAVANGGTGVTTSTGTGSVVLSASPSFTGNVNFGPQIATGTGVSTGDANFELGVLRTGNGPAYMDLHATANSDFNARVFRGSGANGNMEIVNAGTGVLSIATNATEKMRIDSSGNVGIGTSSPSAKLEISGDVRVGSGGDVRVSSATGTTTSAGDSVIFNDANNMIFATGTTTAERMRIDSNGNVGIGISSPSLKLQVNGASGSSQVLDVTNTSAGASLGGIVCSINAGGNNTNSFHFLGVTQTVAVYQLFGNGTTSYTSDIRVKKNVETTRDGYLDDICKLRVVKYNWYNDAEDTPRELGFIAQEVEQVFPGLVQDALYPTKDGICHKVLKGSVMMPIMLKALQEANEKIDALSARLAQLETSAATIKFTGN